MKKTLVAALLGLATTASVLAQGQIIMYNYGANPITYGANSGGTLGANIAGAQWHIAMYGVAGSSAAAINTAFTGDGGNGLVAGVGGLTLATGTATITGDGIYGSSSPATSATFNFSGAGTFVLVAYNGASYDTSLIRGHSAAFTTSAAVSPSTPVALTGQAGDPTAPAFSVVGVPEPSTFALAGLGLASLLIFRRRK